MDKCKMRSGMERILAKYFYGVVPDEDIRRMIGESYDLTKGKRRKL